MEAEAPLPFCTTQHCEHLCIYLITLFLTASSYVFYHVDSLHTQQH